MEYPEVLDKELVGSFPALVKAGGGLVRDAVLEYRVWCHPELGAKDLEEGNDYYYVFEHFNDAQQFHYEQNGTTAPLALVLQKEHINEPEPGVYQHVKEERITEWPVDFLKRTNRTKTTIANFLAPNAPAYRLDVLRGVAIS